VDSIVFSVKGIEMEGFLTDPDPPEGDVKRAMIARAGVGTRGPDGAGQRRDHDHEGAQHDV
jgi:hypothetical protein